MNIKPLYDRILVEPLDADEKTAGGIIIPDTAKEKPVKGKVLKAGNGGVDSEGKRLPMEVKEGDIIIYGKWSGTEIKLDGKNLLIMKESDVFGVVNQ